MTISLSDAGKRFNRDWIFRHFNYHFISGNSYAIVGPNGSGKSTLLQVISGAVGLSEGSVVSRESSAVSPAAENIYQYISIAAPYLEVIEEMTVIEFLEFHQNFKPLLPDTSIKEIISLVGLETAAQKQIRYYSSGMKQRVKLGLALYTDCPVLMLDEPTVNLDNNGIQWYKDHIKENMKDRITIICSNQSYEYDFCNEIIQVK